MSEVERFKRICVDYEIQIAKLIEENDRLNNYVISGHQIIENEMKAEIKRLKQIVTEPGEGNRYRLLMNDNDKLKAENENRIAGAQKIISNQCDEITKLTRKLGIMKKALEWRFKPMHFTSIIINDEAANMANSCLDELMKEALQEAEQE